MASGSLDRTGFDARLPGLNEGSDDPLRIGDQYGTWAQIADSGQLRGGQIGSAAFPLAVEANIGVQGLVLSAGTRADSWITATPRAQPAPPQRLAVPTEYIRGLDSGIQEQFDGVRQPLSRRVDVVEITLDSVLNLVDACEWELVSYEARRSLAAAVGRALDVSARTGWSELRRQVSSPDVRRILDAIEDEPLSPERYASAVRGAYRAREHYESLLATTGADALMFPTTPSLAPRNRLGPRHVEGDFRPDDPAYDAGRGVMGPHGHASGCHRGGHAACRHDHPGERLR